MTNPQKNDIPAQTAGSEGDNPALLLPDENLDQLVGGAGLPDHAKDRETLEDLRAKYYELSKKQDQLAHEQAELVDKMKELFK